MSKKRLFKPASFTRLLGLLALLGSSLAHTADSFPPEAIIYLVDQQGAETSVGKVTFTAQPDGQTAIDVDVDGEAFSDHFLSMRPFRCIAENREWYCYLPYTYDLENRISTDDLTDLEYQLLFIRKSSGDFGIDAWNGLYYRLTRQDDGTLTGVVFEGDLNSLASPPAPDTRPIDLDEFIDAQGERRFPSLVIRP